MICQISRPGYLEKSAQIQIQPKELRVAHLLCARHTHTEQPPHPPANTGSARRTKSCTTHSDRLSPRSSPSRTQSADEPPPFRDRFLRKSTCLGQKATSPSYPKNPRLTIPIRATGHPRVSPPPHPADLPPRTHAGAKGFSSSKPFSCGSCAGTLPML